MRSDIGQRRTPAPGKAPTGPKSPASWRLSTGDPIVAGLTVIEWLGGGAAHEAYLGWDEHLFAPVVVKVVRPDQTDHPGTRRGLLRETQMLGRLNHPVIVRGFRAVLDGPRPHLVLEHVDGPRLSSLLRRDGRLPLQQLLPLGLEMCSALHYLQSSGVVHLDVKPGNIIMGSPPRLIDLSLARPVEDALDLTRVVGTDAYLAPEQCDPPSSGTPGHPADIWGLGTTLFEAAAGYRPFDRGADDEDKPAAERFPQLEAEAFALPPTVPGQVAKPILACLRHDPAQRPTAADLAALLEPLVDQLPQPKIGGFKPRL
ncbi:MAG: serine/threonine-protein kinase [Nocardioidaceae bacterium]